MLRRFFRPRWQHPDPRIRAEAVSRLDPTDPDARQILQRLLAQDPELEVRRRALQRLDDIELLLSLLEGPLATEATQRLGELLRHHETLPDPLPEAVLRHIAHSEDHPRREAALARLNDPETLLERLVREHDPTQRQQLLDRLPDDLPLLERARKTLRNKDKRLARALQQRIDALRAAARLPEEVRAERRRLLTTLDGLRHLRSAEAVAHQLQRLEQAWQAQPLPPEDEQRDQWQRVHARIQAHLEELRAQEARHRRESEARTARRELLQSLERLAQDLEARNDIDPSDLSSARRMLQLQTRAWADRLPLPADEEQRDSAHYRQAVQRVEQALARLERLQALTPRLQALEHRLQALQAQTPPAAEDIAALRRELQSLPPELPAVETLRRRLAELTPGPTVSADWGELRRDLAALERAVSGGRLHQARRLQQRIERRLSQLPPPAGKLRSRLERAQQRLEELADWQRWAAAPQKETLIQEIEALAESALPPPMILDQLKDARERWRKLGAAENEEALRERFDAACERAYQPVAAWRERQREIHARNRARREEFLARLEGFLESVDWNRVDWYKLTRLERDLHREWRELGPTDPASRETLKQRFRTLSRELRRRLEQEWERNLRLRRALIDEARALGEAEDPHQAMQRWRELQEQWRRLGPVSPRQIKALGRAFHQAGDRIVARWREARQESVEQRRQAVAARQRILDAMEEQVRRLEAGEDDPGQWQHHQQAWAEALEVAGSDARRLEERYRRLQQRWQRARQRHQARHQRCQLAQRLRHDLQLRRLEALAGRGRTEAALLLATLPETLDPELEKRRHAALEALEGGRDHDPATSEQVRQALVDLELILGLPTPESEAETRLARQVARLTRQLSGDGDDNQELSEAVGAWITLPPLPPAVLPTVEPRLEAVIQALEGSKEQHASEEKPPREASEKTQEAQQENSR